MLKVSNVYQQVHKEDGHHGGEDEQEDLHENTVVHLQQEIKVKVHAFTQRYVDVRHVSSALYNVVLPPPAGITPSKLGGI